MTELIPGYLFGAIAGGRDNEWVYKTIIEAVEKNGGIILDPHVADLEEARKLRESLGERKLRDYDIDKINHSKFGIGEVSSPSTGAGIEIGRMLFKNKIPVLALRHESSTYRSVIVSFEDDPHYEFYIYSTEEDLKSRINTFMSRFKHL